MKIGQTAVEIWDPDIYPAKVVGVDETVSTYPGSEGKPRLVWRFLLRNEQDEVNEVWYYTGANLSTHPAATLRPLIAALAPELDLKDPDLEIDTEDFVGKRCRVVLGVNQEKGRNVIEKVIPVEARKVSKPAKAADEAEPVAAGAKGEDEPF